MTFIDKMTHHCRLATLTRPQNDIYLARMKSFNDFRLNSSIDILHSW